MNPARVADLACLLFYALLLVAIATIDYRALTVPWLLLILPLSIFIADFLSGVVHLFLDYYPINEKAGFDRLYVYPGDRGSEEFLALRRQVHAHPATRLIDHLAYTFKIHHDRPRAMNRKSYAEHVFETVAPAAVVLAGAFVAPPAVALTLAIAAFLVANVQFIHACVHDTHRSRFWKAVVHRLQAWRVMYSTRAHGIHHRDGVSNFCLVTGWANVLLNPLFALLLRYHIVDRYHWAPPGAPPPREDAGDD